MGTDAEQNLALRGLKHAAGFFQSKVADRLQMRFTPALRFKLDDSVKKSVEIGRLIASAIASDSRPGESAAEPASASGDDRISDEDERGEHPLDDRSADSSSSV
jgi:ribosome-binding factor A